MTGSGRCCVGFVPSSTTAGMSSGISPCNKAPARLTSAMPWLSPRGLGIPDRGQGLDREDRRQRQPMGDSRALGAEGFTFRTNPVQLTELKARVLNTMLRDLTPPLKGVYIAPLVVLVSDDPPALSGSCAEPDGTGRRDDRASRGGSSRGTPDGHLTTSRARSPRYSSRTRGRLRRRRSSATWELVEQVEAGPNWEIWSSRLATRG